ncbi:uncharacterized protein [Physcomitrium patens]|uniref:uncharacterized protein isoform X2 n=1 Tax=Physcomitrium patens TaxID=3218 RepID=UPI003CCD0885
MELRTPAAGGLQARGDSAWRWRREVFMALRGVMGDRLNPVARKGRLIVEWTSFVVARLITFDLSGGVHMRVWGVCVQPLHITRQQRERAGVSNYNLVKSKMVNGHGRDCSKGNNNRTQNDKKAGKSTVERGLIGGRRVKT